MSEALDLDRIQNVLAPAVTRGLLDAAEVVKQEAVQRAPLENGVLRDSASTAAEGNTAVVGFDTDYAIRQHEEVGYDHQDGEAKYLENACIATQTVVAQVIAQSIRRAFS